MQSTTIKRIATAGFVSLALAAGTGSAAYADTADGSSGDGDTSAPRTILCAPGPGGGQQMVCYVTVLGTTYVCYQRDPNGGEWVCDRT